MSPAGSRLTIVVRAQGWVCAIPVRAVIETMRPLPIEPVREAPAFVRGVTVVRGESLPVVDLAVLLGGQSTQQGNRFVTLRVGPRRLALLVDEVIGISERDAGGAQPAPLLSSALAEHVERLGALDGHAFAVLGTARLLSDVPGTLV